MFSRRSGPDTSMNELPSASGSDYIAFRRAVIDGCGATSFRSTARAPVRRLSRRPERRRTLRCRQSSVRNAADFNTAIELLKKVVADDPKHKTAWMDLGRDYMVLRQTDDAITAFKKQAELNPYDEYAYSAMGWAYTTERKYDEAAEAFNKAIEINPLSLYAHAALGAMYQESHQYEKAVPELEKAASLKSDDSVCRSVWATPI